MIDPQVIREYREIRWENLLRADLGPAGQLNEVKPVFDRIKILFDRLTNDPAVNSLAQNAVDSIQREIQNFLRFITNTIYPFSDVRQRPNIELQVRNIEFQIINSLGNLKSYLSLLEESGLKDKQIQKIVDNSLTKVTQAIEQQEKKIAQLPNIDLSEARTFIEGIPKLEETLTQATDLAVKLNQNSPAIEDAIVKAKDLISKNEEAIGQVVKLNATDAAKKAVEHKTFKIEWLWWVPLPKGSYLWLLGSMSFGALVLGIVLFFAFKDTTGDISVGHAILRISAILAPSYFAVFCSQQFLNHRRLYEAYKFKDLALQTMLNLRLQLSDDSDYEIKKLLTEEGVRVLFAEPAFKEDLKYDKNLVMEIMEVLKNLRK